MVEKENSEGYQMGHPEAQDGPGPEIQSPWTHEDDANGSVKPGPHSPGVKSCPRSESVA